LNTLYRKLTFNAAIFFEVLSSREAVFSKVEVERCLLKVEVERSFEKLKWSGQNRTVNF